MTQDNKRTRRGEDAIASLVAARKALITAFGDDTLYALEVDDIVRRVAGDAAVPPPRTKTKRRSKWRRLLGRE